MSVPNVLATRYASEAMRQIWAPENKIILERQLWIAVLEAQRDLGVDFGGGFTSGCSSRASLRYARLISSGPASRPTPTR